MDRAGRVLGRHKGLPCYTAGQRKGLGVAAGKHVYVLSKNGADNTILLGDDAELYASSLLASHVNWISGETPAQPVRCAAKTRYSQTEAPCTAYPLPDGGLRVVFPGTVGIPAEFGQIQKIILDILPCHLDVEFYFRYLTWAECEAAEYTWDGVESAGHTWESFSLAVPAEV